MPNIACDRKRLLSHPLGLVVPTGGTTSPNAWDVSSSVFLYMTICILPYVTQKGSPFNSRGRLNAKYSLRPKTIIVPPVGTGCPMRWDNQSQRMGRFGFRIFVYDNPHTAFGYLHHLHHLHRYLHHFSSSLSACYALVYAVYANFKKIFIYAFACTIFF